MDLRILARGLRARPTPFLQHAHALPRFSIPSVRYNSSDSSTPSPSAFTTPSNQGTPKTGVNPSPEFNGILDSLDFAKKQRETPKSNSVYSDRISKAVGRGAQSGYRPRPPSLQIRKIEMKLGPTLGRQAQVEPERGIDLASALRRLTSTIAQNKLRQDAASQRFHTRRGMVIKQKKMQRWKKLFKYSFQGTVQKIQRMQAQGW